MSVNIRELNNAPKKTSFKGIKWAVIAAAAILLAANSFTIVPAGNTGVVLTLGEVSSNPLSEGFHVKAPFVQTVEKMSNKIQVFEARATAVSRDLQTVWRRSRRLLPCLARQVTRPDWIRSPGESSGRSSGGRVAHRSGLLGPLSGRRVFW